jgi:hypothetical protein
MHMRIYSVLANSSLSGAGLETMKRLGLVRARMNSFRAMICLAQQPEGVVAASYLHLPHFFMYWQATRLEMMKKGQRQASVKVQSF